MKNGYRAEIIGETSGGLTAIEICLDDELIYSHDYFSSGATSEYYNKALRQIFDDAMACDTCEALDWDGNDDKFYDIGTTTWVVASYTSCGGWKFAAPRNDGQAKDFILANRDRIHADVVAAWENF